MTVTIYRNHFSSEAEAVAEIEQAGLHAAAVDIPAVENDFHWHDFDAAVYIISGELNVERRDGGEKYTLRAGDKAIAKAGVVHRERHDGVRAVFGLSVPPSELFMPIEKSPELLKSG